MFNYKQKISNHLTTHIIIILTIMIIIVGFVVFQYSQSVLSDELASRINIENKNAIQQIENLFEDTSTFVKQMMFDPEIKKYLKEVDTRDDILNHPSYNAVLESMNAIEKSNDRIFLVWVANEEANFYLDDTGVVSGEDYSVFKRPWHDVALQNNVINYTNPYIEWETKKYVVSSIATVTEPNGNRYFYVVDFDLGIVLEVVESIDVGNRGHVMIVDAFGKYIYHENPDNILTSAVSDTDPEIAKWLDKDHEEMSSLVYDGEIYYVASQSINYSNWRLITMVNKKEFESGLNAFIFYLLIFLVMITSSVIGVIFLVINKRLKPIDALSVYGEQIAQGNFESEPPYQYAQLQDEMGKMARSFVTITEVFNQKNKELEDIVVSQYEEIKQQYQYIIEKEKIASLGVLVAGVAHEINTPLGNGVTSCSFIENEIHRLNKLFHENKLSKSEFEKILGALTDASDLLMNNLTRASELVKQFKTIAINQNIESLKSIDLREEIDKIIISLRPALKRIVIEIQNEVPQGILMVTYPGAISQVITNFVMNSLHHGFVDRDKGLITIIAEQEGQLVRMSYKDDGKGIPDDIVAHIFEPFYTTRRNKENSGLGMFIIHNLVNQTLSGTLTCVSTEVGVQFDLTLPLELKAKKIETPSD